jgi:hypothetical protein
MCFCAAVSCGFDGEGNRVDSIAGAFRGTSSIVTVAAVTFSGAVDSKPGFDGLAAEFRRSSSFMTGAADADAFGGVFDADIPAFLATGSSNAIECLVDFCAGIMGM